jgi:hypothetical protein
VVARALKSEIVFHRDAAGLPRREHALWFLSQMARWGQVGADLDLDAVADRVYRPDLFREAALSLGPVLEPAQVFADAALRPRPCSTARRSIRPTRRGYAASFAVGRAARWLASIL